MAEPQDQVGHLLCAISSGPALLVTNESIRRDFSSADSPTAEFASPATVRRAQCCAQRAVAGLPPISRPSPARSLNAGQTCGWTLNPRRWNDSR